MSRCFTPDFSGFVFGLIWVVCSQSGSIDLVLVGSLSWCCELWHLACPPLSCFGRPQLPRRCVCFQLFRVAQGHVLHQSHVACILDISQPQSCSRSRHEPTLFFSHLFLSLFPLMVCVLAQLGAQRSSSLFPLSTPSPPLVASIALLWPLPRHHSPRMPLLLSSCFPLFLLLFLSPQRYGVLSSFF